MENFCSFSSLAAGYTVGNWGRGGLGLAANGTSHECIIHRDYNIIIRPPLYVKAMWICPKGDAVLCTIQYTHVYGDVII